MYAPAIALKAITFESLVSISVTSPIALGDVVSTVTSIVVLYSLVEPSELVANIVIATASPEAKLLLSNTVT